MLCVNTRYTNNEELVRFEEMALDVKAAIAFLRKQPGITKVLLFGHSGGGPTVSFYQAVAENGIAYCQKPERLVKCTDALANLPPADGIVFADSHPGNPVNVLRGLNPAVLNEKDPPDAGFDPALDPFWQAMSEMQVLLIFHPYDEQPAAGLRELGLAWIHCWLI